MRSASRLRVERSFGRRTSKGLREELRRGLRGELREALQDELERRGSRSFDELRAASDSFEQLRTASSFLVERRRRFEGPRTIPKSCEHLRSPLNSLERLSRASRSVEEEPREDQRRGGPLYAPWDSVASESRPAVPPRTALEVFVHELHCIQATVSRSDCRRRHGLLRSGTNLLEVFCGAPNARRSRVSKISEELQTQ